MRTRFGRLLPRRGGKRTIPASRDRISYRFCASRSYAHEYRELILGLQDERQKRRDQDQSHQRGIKKSAQDHRAQTPVQLTAGAWSYHEGNQTEDGSYRSHKDRPDAILHTFQDRSAQVFSFLAHVDERLLDNEDGVVHGRAHDDHEAQHRDHVQRREHKTVQ